MKKINPIVAFIIISIMIISFSMLFFIPVILSKSIDDQFGEIILAIFIIYIISFIIISIYRYNKTQKYINQIIQEVPPRKGIITDVLIYVVITRRYTSNEKDRHFRYEYCPIVKDINTNKLYVSLKNENLNIISYGPSIISPISYVLKSLKNKEIKIGDQVNIHLKNENGKINKCNDSICISENNYKYKGKISNFKLMDYNEKYLLFNETSDNFLEDLNNINIFEGIIDFDAYKQ